MILHDTPKNLQRQIFELCPDAAIAVLGSTIYAQMLPYQAMALYHLTTRFNQDGVRILEIGTAAGFSASIMAQAAPKAKITTLNHRDWEVKTARVNLLPWSNVTVIEAASWDFLQNYTGPPEFDMVFVDGNHNRVGRDMPWFNLLKVGGLMLFHDYSENSSPIVFNTVNDFMVQLGRELDVKIVDTNAIGMAGIYRKDGEQWQI